ncbi:MAG: hypothetical protein P1S60_07655 [Anaerolineae bacterium]|nr:hypothetical protein [Anaerolineae bacterium]
MANRVRTRVPCPSCEELITSVDQPKLHTKIKCPHCKVDLVVVEIDPVEFDWDDMEEFDDDWDDDDDTDDDWN